MFDEPPDKKGDPIFRKDTVCIHKSKKLSGRFLPPPISGRRRSPSGFEKVTNGVFFNEKPGTIRRAIVYGDDFDPVRGVILPKQALEAPFDEFLFVPDRDDKADKRKGLLEQGHSLKVRRWAATGPYYNTPLKAARSEKSALFEIMRRSVIL